MLRGFQVGFRGFVGPANPSSSSRILGGPSLLTKGIEGPRIPRPPLHIFQARGALVHSACCRLSGTAPLRALERPQLTGGSLAPAIRASSGQRVGPSASVPAGSVFPLQPASCILSLAGVCPGAPVTLMASEIPACQLPSLHRRSRLEGRVRCCSATAKPATEEETAASPSKASRGSEKSPPYRVGSSGLGPGGRVSLWGLVSFIKEEKLTVGGILLALLLSSGAQLLLPLAVGRLIDALTQKPPEIKQQQQFETEQDLGSVEEDVAGPLPSKESLSEPAPTVPLHSQPTAAAIDASAAPAETSSPVSADPFGYGGLREAIEKKLKTPEARVGLCVALGAVGAATSFLRLYLLESTVRQRLRS